MAENKESKPLCKSVFKSGENITTEQKFTKKWIELINMLEKGENIKFFKKTWQ